MVRMTYLCVGIEKGKGQQTYFWRIFCLVRWWRTGDYVWRPRIKTLKKICYLVTENSLPKLNNFGIELKDQIKLIIVPSVSCPLVPNPSSKSWPTEGFGLLNIFILLQCFLSIDDELWLQSKGAHEKKALRFHLHFE